ncbi:MAG: oligosaccharide flippase family protein [Pseudorhodobacter sp.]|nr:oligosaccharide flippase family protein [Pseudorhodobacter sp.]
MTIKVKTAGTGSTATNIALTFGRQFMVGLMQLGLIVTVARLLGPEGAGAFAVALLLPTLMGTLLNFGIGSANVYFVASRQVSLEQAWAASRDLMVAVALFGIAMGAALILMASDTLFPGVAQSVLLLALTIYPFSLMMSIVAGLFQAMQDFRSFNLAMIAQPALALTGAFTLWASGAFNLVALIGVVSVSHAVGLGLALSLLRRRIPLLDGICAHMPYLRKALGYGVKAHLGNILSFLNYRLDLFLVNLLAGPAAAGLYAVAVRLSEQLWIISQAVSTVIFPRLSAMAGDEAARRRFTPVVARLVLWITLFGAGVLAVIARPLIELLFGTEFLAAEWVMYILLPGIVLLSCARVLAHDLAARGWVGVNLAIATIAVAINLIGNALLIPKIGISGAAAATSAAYLFMFLMNLEIQRRNFLQPFSVMILLSRHDIKEIVKSYSK